MLKRRNKTPDAVRESAAEPMAEGIRKRRKPKGFYSDMSDVELVVYVKGFMDKNGIKTKRELRGKNRVLGIILHERMKKNPQIIEKVGFEREKNDWDSMDDEEFVAHVKGVMKHRGIRSSSELEKAESGLYSAFLRRMKKNPDVKKKIGFERKLRDWASMSDEELVAYAKRVMERDGIRRRKELDEKHPRLYGALLKRKRKSPGIMDRIGFEDTFRDWESMDDEEFIAYIKDFMAKTGIRSKGELIGQDGGLYHQLQKRVKKNQGIMERIGFQIVRRNYRQMDNEEFVAYIRDFMKRRGIGSSSELEKIDSSLYSALLRRNKEDPGILDRIEFEKKRRDWASMSDEELVAYIRDFMGEAGIECKNELWRADGSLYNAIRKRDRKNPGLFESIGFKEKRREWSDMDDGELVEYAKKYIAEKGINGRKELADAISGLYNALRKRKLMDELGLEMRLRDWAGMSDEELVAFAKEFIAVNGISNRSKLSHVKSGLYKILKKRGLLGSIRFERRLRNWAGMSDEEVIKFARGVIAEKGIDARKELHGADHVLYEVLRKRKLLDDVFSDIESSKHAEAVQGVLDALESFGERDA